jgi:arabinofuranan 3-O-arabinosyltransferase
MSANRQSIALPTPKRLWLYGTLTVAAWTLNSILQIMNGWWLIDASGKPRDSNVLSLWAAGHMARSGEAAAVYDPAAIGAAEHAAVNTDFPTMPWLYPPSFLLLAACLNLLPYLWACAAYLSISGLTYVAAIRAILPHRLGPVLALAAPATLVNLILAETGFLVGGLSGFTLYWLEARPILAGISLGLLTFKPQLGLLFPLVLVATGRWRAFFSAAITVLLLAGLVWLCFGAHAWIDYLQALPAVGNTVIGDRTAVLGTAVDWHNIQTWFSVARYLGTGATASWAVYAATTSCLAVALCLFWRSRAAYDLKAAALATGSFLATPYVMAYDSVLLVVAVAFLIRHGLARGFRRGDVEICAAVLFSPFYLMFLPGIVPLLPFLFTGFLIWLFRRARDGSAPAAA